MYKKLININTLSTSLLLISLLQISACSEEAPAVAAAAVSTPPPQQTTPVAVAPQTSTVPSANKGTVKSIQHMGGYSYIETDIDGSTFWIASSISSAKPQDKIAWNDYALMKNFTSKSLNRTFDQILFVDKVVAAEAMATTGHSGVVTETMISAGYSYIQVDQQGKKIWLAAPISEVSVGQNISWSGSAPMHNFSSQSLNRTFDEIYFVGAIQVNQI